MEEAKILLVLALLTIGVFYCLWRKSVAEGGDEEFAEIKDWDSAE